MLTYQMGDYSNFTLAPGDHVTLNGGTEFALPERRDNSVPTNASRIYWCGAFRTRCACPLGAIPHDGPSPLAIGDNAFQFFVENTGILNVHVEIAYPARQRAGLHAARGDPSVSAAQRPAATRPASALRPQIGDTQVDGTYRLTADPPARIAVTGNVPINFVVGNNSYANWAPELMVVPGAKHRDLELGRHGGHRKHRRSHPAERRRRIDQPAPAHAGDRARRADAAGPLYPELRQHAVREWRL